MVVTYQRLTEAALTVTELYVWTEGCQTDTFVRLMSDPYMTNHYDYGVSTETEARGASLVFFVFW